MIKKTNTIEGPRAVEEAFIFDDSINPETGKRNHSYTLDGKPLTSVTTILKVIGKGDGITQWGANECAKVFVREIGAGNTNIPQITQSAKYEWKRSLEEAGKFGTNVHKAIENYVKNEDFPGGLNEMEHKAFDNFIDWWESNDVKLVASELKVYSKALWYAGTIDLVLELDGKYWIGDVKTSSAIYPEYFFQTAAYQKALLERGFDKEIYGHVIINVNKIGGINIKKSYGYDRNIKGFMAALEIYRVKQDLLAELKK